MNTGTQFKCRIINIFSSENLNYSALSKINTGKHLNMMTILRFDRRQLHSPNDKNLETTAARPQQYL